MDGKHYSASSICAVTAAFLAMAPHARSSGLGAGALEGDRYRILISSDIGGSDDDDDQSFVHFLVYADLVDIEGLVSSPPYAGRAEDFHKVIDIYEKDYPNLKTYSADYPTPTYLRSIVKQGAVGKAPTAGYSSATEGSEWIVACAKKDDPRPLHVLVWGSITDVAQALHDAPEIKDRMRVHFIAGWNQNQCPYSYDYIDKTHPDTWLVHDKETFRGWYVGGEQSGDLGNAAFVTNHVDGHGCLGDYFAPLKSGKIKMGDTPSFSRLLRCEDPDDPTRASWGGQFIRKNGRPNWFIDNPDPALAEGNYSGAKTVNTWREQYLRDWQTRMDRCASPNNTTSVMSGDAARAAKVEARQADAGAIRMCRADGRLRISGLGVHESYQVRIRDLAGRKVADYSVRADAGHIDLVLPNASAGHLVDVRGEKRRVLRLVPSIPGD